MRYSYACSKITELLSNYYLVNYILSRFRFNGGNTIIQHQAEIPHPLNTMQSYSRKITHLLQLIHILAAESILTFINHLYTVYNVSYAAG